MTSIRDAKGVYSWLLPHDLTARMITLRVLIPVALVYVGRVLIHQELEQTRGPLGSLWWIICPLVCLVGAALAAVVVGLAIVSARNARHIAPALVLLGGVALTPFLPLPPLHEPVFPEQEFFATHRAAFERVVSLARQDRLDCIEDRGCEVSALELPVGYTHLSENGRVWVSGTDSAHLVVEFQPFDFYYPVIYFQMPEDARGYRDPDCQYARDTRRLDQNWFLCVYEWN